MTTPAQLGFYMPAEWERHRGTWLTWPRKQGVSFPGSYSAGISEVYSELIRVLVQGEAVFINVWDAAMERDVRGLLAKRKVPLKRVGFYRFQAYEPWCRDHGPIFLKHRARGQKAVVDWDYNAWGGKYPPFDLDDAIPARIAALRRLSRHRPGLVLEGGAIDVNGRGILLTTESCLLNPNRNPGRTQPEIETVLRDYLGVRQVLWLGEGIAGDDTDGHVDDLARFVNARTMVAAVEEDPLDPNYEPLKENWRRLQAWRGSDGESLRIVKLPMPARVEREGVRLPASYANFYVANRSVVVPTFRDPKDRQAVAILKPFFPGREVIGMDSTELIWGRGSFHCITQQEPA